MLVCLGPAGEDDVVPVLARLRRETRVFGDLRLPPSTMKMLLAISIDRSDSFRDRCRREKKIDLKREALLPIANIARWAALSVGASALHTQERLQAAAGSRMMTAEDADTLADVFEIVQHVRLRHQLEQLEAGSRRTR
jgi:CBS domain-containing protein